MVKKFIILCLIFIVLTGCDNTAGNEQNKQNEQNEQNETSETNEALSEENNLTENASANSNSEEEQTPPTPKNGGTLRMSMRIPKTLNPLINDDVTVDNALKLVFEPLFYIDSNDKVVPNIAEGYSLSSNGLELTINLRSDVKWEDGEKITAEDVIYSLDTIRANPASIYSKAMTNVAGYSAVSSSAVSIRYSGVYGACMYNLCFPVIPKHYYVSKTSKKKESEGDKSGELSMQPMGNGLYKFKSYDTVKKMTLKKSSNFRGTPYIDTIEFIITDNDDTDLYAFEQEVTDVITVDVSQWGKFNNSRNSNSIKINTNNFEFLGYNFNSPIFQNINVRKAIAFAIPSNEITENIYLSNASASLVPINPSSWLSCTAELISYNYNLQSAQQFITQSGFGRDALTFNLIVNKENNERCESAKLIASCLNQIGMNIKILQLPFEEYKKALDENNFDLFLGGVKLSNTPDLRCLLASYSVGEGGINYTNYSDANMDALLGQALGAVGEDEYKEYMASIQKYCADQLPFIGILFKDSILLTNENIYGESPTAENSLNGIQNWFINDEVGEK